MDQMLPQTETLERDMTAFAEERSKENENFCYWYQFLVVFKVVTDLIRADREGLWDLHMDSMQRALVIFSSCGSTNYQRWGLHYHEEMKNLPSSAPSVYESFKKGDFSIKERHGRFTAVGGGQKLEQSINLSSKSNDSVIGNAKKKNFVAQWDLIFHEMMALKNVHRTYYKVADLCQESWTHHESSQKKTDEKEAQVQAVIRFIESKGSPFVSSGSKILQNLVTKVVMSAEIRDDLLNLLENGQKIYENLRKERYILKTKKIGDRIPRAQLKNMKSNSKTTKATTKKSCSENKHHREEH